LERVITHQTADRERWLNALVHDELGVVAQNPLVPWRQGFQIGASFVVVPVLATVRIRAKIAIFLSHG